MKNILLILLPIIFIGCTTTRETTSKRKVERVAMSEPREVSGTALSGKNLRDVRYNEAIKNYPVGAYIDPNNPNVRHDPHNIQRLESDGDWNLNPNVATISPIGTATAVSDPNQKTTPVTAELEQYTRTLQLALQAAIEQNKTLSEKLDGIEKTVSFNTNLADYTMFKEQLTKQSDQIWNLREELKKAKEEINSFKKSKKDERSPSLSKVEAINYKEIIRD